jgi:POT family proton-dependent oligopeptide transporter
VTQAADRTLYGHPRALGYLAAAEFGIGFSFYGMQSLLALYLINHLLKPGAEVDVWGMRWLTELLSSLYGPLSGQPLASAIIAFYGALVFGLPMLGGLIADRGVNRTTMVIVGTALMTIGHFLMAFEATFLIALATIAVGSGCAGGLRGQVGALYAQNDLRRPDAFQIYMIALSTSVILAPLVCGSLGERIAWHFGFGVAGLGMLIGMLVYLRGVPQYRVAMRFEPAAGARSRRTIGRDGWRAIVVLLALLPVLALANIGNVQIYSAYLIWAQSNYDLHVLGFSMPVSWLLSIDALLSTAATAGSIWFWGRVARWRPVDEIMRMAVGAGVAALAVLLLAVGAKFAGGNRLGLGWALAFHAVNAAGFVNIYGIGMALYARVAPPGLNTTMVNVYLVHLVIANLLAGWLAGLMPVFSGETFWLLHAALISLSALLFFAAGASLRSILAPGEPTHST